jgi:hypothetical protein
LGEQLLDLVVRITAFGCLLRSRELLSLDLFVDELQLAVEVFDDVIELTSFFNVIASSYRGY